MVLPEGSISYARRVRDLALEHPEKIAIVFAPVNGEPTQTSWREFDSMSNRAGRLLQQHDVGQGSTVIIALPNCLDHYFLTYGAWKLGASVIPVRWDVPEWERERLLAISSASLVIGEWTSDTIASMSRQAVGSMADLSDDPLPDRVAYPARSIASGGSTGKPKIISTPEPSAGVPGELTKASEVFGWGPGHVRLIPGPLYHMSPFVWSFVGLFEDQTIVTVEQFRAPQVIDLIERFRIQEALLVPTHLYRMSRVPGFEKRDFSSVISFVSGGAKLAPWLFHKWIEVLGPERIWEAYGSTEEHGSTIIRGDEWLEHPGSVGRPDDLLLRICDENGNELPNGQVGEIYMRWAASDKPTFEYIGGQSAKRTPDGLVSVGDLGWVDDEGYLYVADRRVDMIISGGANIYPAEIEACLSENQEVADVAVIGIADDDWGRRVHAIVVPRDESAPPSVAELEAFCRARLASYKVPKSFELVPVLPRNDVGKIQRSGLVAARERATEPDLGSVRK